MVLKAHLDPVSAVFDDRREPRRAMQIEASGALPGGLEANVTVHNLSVTGLLLETQLPLEDGEVLTLDLPGIGEVDAAIVWQSEPLYGCAFADPLPDDALQNQTSINPANFGTAPQRTAPMSHEAFGVRLNRLRRERSLTLAQVADALEVSKPTVWAWEKGKARPLPERIAGIAEALGVSIDELAQSREGDQGQSVIEDCRLRIATSYGTAPENIRIMIEI